MKTVRITDISHEKLLRVAGRLQAAHGKGKNLDDAIDMLTSLDEIFADYELGLEFEKMLYKDITKEEAFLWFWGIASLAKVLWECYGFDSLAKYALAFVAKRFSDRLEILGSHPLDGGLLKHFETQAETPLEVKNFLRKCLNEGYGNWVASGKIDIGDLRRYMMFIVCYENDHWENRCLENIKRHFSIVFR
jgi:hypothetical protein